MKATKSYLIKLSLLVCMLFSFMAFTASAAYKSYDGLFDYVLSNGSAVITGYSGISTTLTIEPTIKNADGTKTYPVISIGNGTKPILTSPQTKKVVIPDSAVRIATNAFLDCTSLQEVKIGASVKSIGDSAFQGCTGLKSVTMTSTALKQLGDASFYGCVALTSFDCGPALETIGDSTFAGCKALTTVTLSKTLQAIGENAFKGCTALTKISDNSTPHPMNYYYGSFSAFENYLPDSLELIGAYAFYNCGIQGNILIPANVLEIPESTFQNCKKLTGIYMTTGVKTIGDNAFKGCTAVTKMFAPRSLEEVSDNAFAGATLDDSRTVVYLFMNSYIDKYLNSTKQYNAHMFSYQNVTTLPTTTTIKLTAPDAADPMHPVIWAGQTIDLAISYYKDGYKLGDAKFPIPAKEIGDTILWETNKPGAVIFVKKNQNAATVTSTSSGTGYVVKASLNSNVDGDITIKVNPAPKSVAIARDSSTTPASKYTVDLMKAKSLKLNAITAPMKGAEVTWSSNNKNIATVDATGLVTWKGKEGTAKITATTYNGKKTTVEVAFKYNYNEKNTLAFVNKEVVETVVSTKPIQISKNPSGFAASTVLKLSDPSVAKVTPDGYLTPLKVGATVLTGTDVSGTIAPAGKAYKFKCTIIVKPAKQVMNSKVTKTSKGYKVSWKKILKGSGYDIQVKAPGKSSFKTVSVKRTRKQNSYVFPNLKAGKTYQVRVRTYLNYGGKKYPGAWSKPISIKTKK